MLPVCKEFDKPRSVEGSRLLRVVPGRTQIGPVLDGCVSEDQGLICTEILGPTESLRVDSAWVRVTQLAGQTREL